METKEKKNEKIKVGARNRIEKVTQNQVKNEPNAKGSVQSGNIPAPDQATVTGWVRKDIDSAIYFLSMLREHPELIEKMAVEIFNFSKTHNPNLDGTGGTNSNE